MSSEEAGMNYTKTATLRIVDWDAQHRVMQEQVQGLADRLGVSPEGAGFVVAGTQERVYAISDLLHAALDALGLARPEAK